MSLLDKIKSAFTREKVIVVEVQKMGTGISANFSGNNNYGSGAKFPGGMSSSQSVIIHDHYSIRQKARDAMYDRG